MSATKICLCILFQGFFSGFSCQDSVSWPKIEALIGSCVEIPCPFLFTREPRTFNVVWYLYDEVRDKEVFNSNDFSSAKYGIKSRSSLVRRSCSLRINPVRSEDLGYYYARIERSKKAALETDYVYLDVTDSIRPPMLEGFGAMREGKATTIKCQINHTCTFRPPDIEWNLLGDTEEKSIYLPDGYWGKESTLTFIPSYTDHWKTIQCTAIFTGALKSQQEAHLNVKYPPKNVTVTFKESKEIMAVSAVILSCNCKSNPDAYKYEWYKGKEKMKLQNQGSMITVILTTTEPYSCMAINEEGKGGSPLTEIPLQYYKQLPIRGYRGTYVSLSVILLLLLLFFIFVGLGNNISQTSSISKLHIRNTQARTENQGPARTDLTETDNTGMYEILKPVKPLKERSELDVSEYEVMTLWTPLSPTSRVRVKTLT